jgi:DNA-binding transcriptional LysR family regulator
MTHFGIDSWSFPPIDGSTIPRAVQFTPRFVVNSIRAAVASAVQGRGVVRMFSYHLADAVADGTLRIILAGDEHPPLPVHLVSPHRRLSVPKVRAFVDFALPKLREGFEERGLACSAPASSPRSRSQ